MKTKSIKTSEYIIKKVSTIFNQKGYIGTSLSEIEKATNLTKGAIYCNFKNKNDLALKVFKYNVEKVLTPLSKRIEKKNTSYEKLLEIADFYGNYYELMYKIGGCPILNICIDAKNNNDVLFNKGMSISKLLINDIENIIKFGIKRKELKNSINAKELSMNIYAMIEGAIFLSFTHETPAFLKNISKHLKELIISYKI